DRTTAILFGDGAGAVVLGRGGGLVGAHLGADGRRAGDLCIAAGGSRHPVDEEAIAARLHKIAMNGPEVFRAAVEAMADALAEADTAGHLVPGDLIGLTAAGAGLTWGAAILRWSRGAV